MRFLVVTKAKHPWPPEMGEGLFDAMIAWLDQNERAGNLEQSWNFAGIQGGGGILKVDSLEELDGIMTAFPLAPFSETSIFALTDLRANLASGKAVFQAMSAG